MDTAQILCLIQNTALLLAVAFIFDVVASRWRTRPSLFHQVSLGFTIGVIGIAVMMTPWAFKPGIVFDARSVLIGISGLFFGSLATTIAITMTAAFRIYQSGTGVWTGIAVIITSGLIGIAWRHFRHRSLEAMSWRELYLFGMVIHLAMLGLMFTLPRATALQVLSSIALPVILIYPLGTALLGVLMLHRLRRERTDDALQASEENFRHTLDVSPFGVRIATAEGETIYANRAILDIYGFDNLEELKTTPVETRYTAESYIEFKKRHEKRQQGKDSPSEYEISIVRKDGKVRHLLVFRKELLWNGKKQYQTLYQDMTKRKHAEEALMESTALNDAVVENAPLMIFLKKATDLRFVLFNRAGEELLGYDRKALLGKNDLDIFPPEQAANFMANDREVLDGKAGILDIMEEDILTAKKGRRLVHTRKVCIRGADGTAKYLLGISEDITEHKQVEKSHARLAMAVEQSADVVLITDANAKILYANPAFEKITGYTHAEAIGQNVRILKSGKQDAEFYRQMWAVLNRGEVWIGHMINKRKDGTFYEEETSISPVRDPAGKIVNYVAVNHDITREVQLESQLRQAQKMEAVGRLAGGMAHDFNNILQIILGNVELALDQIEPGNPLRRDLEEIKSAGRRSADLIRQLLGFARKQTFTPKTMDLNKTVGGMLDMLRRLIGENIEIVWKPGAGLWPVMMDRVQIDQILVNLCANARDVITEVGVVTIATENVHVDDLHVARHDEICPGDYVMLIVSDTGCGMNKETQDKIFEPFFTTKEVGKGTGLGLATVYGILHQNRGDIAVYSEPGMGTTFHIYLPRYMSNDAAPAVEDPAAQPLPHGCETVLLVDDNLSILDKCSLCLQKLGYTVLVAGTPEMALRLMEEHADEIKLLVTDVIMPGMKGTELAGQLKARNPNIKCLFMSGLTMEIITHRDILDGTGHFIQKPFSITDLATKVREALAGA